MTSEGGSAVLSWPSAGVALRYAKDLLELAALELRLVLDRTSPDADAETVPVPMPMLWTLLWRERGGDREKSKKLDESSESMLSV